ncbi:MAG TPA: hypothetical protein VGO09_04845 [Flavisolibacter sp.]|nr:hypothetical protein [Flavisolibacter sp.]
MKKLLFMGLTGILLSCNNASDTTITDKDHTTVNDTSSVSPSIPRSDTVRPLMDSGRRKGLK